MGTFKGRAADRRYVVTKSSFADGRALKLVAEELGGPDYISLNWYDLGSGPVLKPCEMPAAKVIAQLNRPLDQRGIRRRQGILIEPNIVFEPGPAVSAKL